MKKKTISSAAVMLMAMCFMALPAYANSSWVWISEKRPFDLLPFVALGTLVIEIAAIKCITKVDSLIKTSAVVTLANLVSFAAPYVWFGLFYTDLYGEFSNALDRIPYYTVGVVFLVVTIVCEMPVVYLLLKKNTENRGRLIFSTLGANTITTVIVAIAERTLCHGKY